MQTYPHTLMAFFFPLLFLLTGCDPGNRDAASADAPTIEEPPLPRADEVTDATTYIGAGHPPMPAGVEKLAGAVAEASDQSIVEAEYGFEHVRTGTGEMLWLSRLQGRDASGAPRWRVIDVVELPTLSPDQRFLLTCSSDKYPSLAAIAQTEPREVLTRISRAWRIDRASGRLVEIETSGVQCRQQLVE